VDFSFRLLINFFTHFLKKIIFKPLEILGYNFYISLGKKLNGFMALKLVLNS